MILCGALDGEFPIAYRSERFLGKELYESEKRHFQAERLLFYQFLTNAPELLNSGDKRIYITYPASENDRETVRSSFIDELLKVTTLKQDGKIVALDEVSGSPKYEWTRALLSSTDILKFYCENKAANGDDPAINRIVEIAREHGWSHLIEFQKSGGQRTDQKDADVLLNLAALPENIRQIFAKKTSQPVSITDLETYAKCPYQYFVKKLIGLASPEEPDLALSPLEKGSLLHKIVYRFYSSLQAIDPAKIIEPNELFMPKFIGVRLNPDEKDRYRDMLREIAREEIDRIKFDHPFFDLEENRIIGKGSEKGYIDIWLQREIYRAEINWPFMPGLFEFAFGMPAKSTREGLPPIDFDGRFSLRGKIDRIEIDFNAETPRILIVDYKIRAKKEFTTGKILSGNDFQMPLYIAAARRILKEKYGLGTEPAFAAYYGFKPIFIKKDQLFEYERAVMIENSEEVPDGMSKSKFTRNMNINTAIEISIDYAADIVDNIRRGRFPVEPDKTACQYCEFAALCRVDETKFEAS
jgi:ATP-dependent helicase/nuclease subunit B